MRVPFFRVAERKEPKKGRPHCLRPLRFASGQPAVLRFGRVSLELAALRQSRALIRQTLRSSAHPEGQRGQNSHSGHRCARPILAGASATRCANWAERSKGPCGCFAPFAPLDAPRSAAGGVACVPKDTHASLSSSPQLFERSAPARSEFCGAPRSRAPQVAPARSAGVADSGVAFSLVTFFWRRKRKLLARRAIPGLRPQRRHAAISAHATKNYKINSS